MCGAHRERPARPPLRYARRFDREDGQRTPAGRRRGGLATVTGPDTDGHRCRRGGHAGEPYAAMLAELGLRQENMDESHAHQEV